MIIVGIAGFKGSGKSVAGKAIRDAFGCDRGSFADPMKAFCADVFQWDKDRLYGSSSEREKPDPLWNGLTPRFALQRLGTDWGRRCHPDIWVRYAMRHKRNVVFEDVRFVNEAQAILDNGGIVLFIERPSVVPPSWRFWLAWLLGAVGLRGLAGKVLHESESELSRVRRLLGVDRLLNDGSITELERKAQGWVSLHVRR